ncbi:MAG: DnaB-like helicase C-terminal domain-containing protein [Chromatiales bacterium]|nr:DnaB-like helicase C-terminal domain-containing protein [Chromatiales bacterium]
MGKTAFALNIAEHVAVAAKGCRWLVFSMEMGALAAGAAHGRLARAHRPAAPAHRHARRRRLGRG